MTGQSNRLVWMLRLLGLVNFAALVAVLAPRTWLEWSHSELGLGTFPRPPIAGYLARSTSLWFAAFGVFLWFLSRDVVRNAATISFIGWAMIVQGLFMIWIDWHEGLPGWWIVAEGPSCLVLGTLVLTLQRRSRESS